MTNAELGRRLAVIGRQLLLELVFAWTMGLVLLSLRLVQASVSQLLLCIAILGDCSVRLTTLRQRGSAST